MKVIFVRHGKDDDRYRGGWSKLDLTEEGKNQAKELADYIRNNQKEFNITKIISSDLPRAMSTAKYISDKLQVPIVLEKELRETNNGDLAGMLNEEALIKYPNVFFNTLQLDEAYPNGESPLEFFVRIEEWFQRFLKEYHDYLENILIVTHGGVINIIYHIVNNIEWSNKNRSFRIDTCSLHVLDLESMQFEIKNLCVC